MFDNYFGFTIYTRACYLFFNEISNRKDVVIVLWFYFFLVLMETRET